MLLEEIPYPVLFNCTKHHLLFISYFIAHWAQRANLNQEFYNALVSIGSSQMDLYTGNVLPHQIAQQVITRLQEEGVFSRPGYEQFLQQTTSGYRKLTLDDDSQWVLRLGTWEGRYIHIHPGRYSPHSIRVKANTLKTVIATLISTTKGQENIDTDTINEVRINVLRISPVRSLEEAAGIEKLLQLIKNALPKIG